MIATVATAIERPLVVMCSSTILSL